MRARLGRKVTGNFRKSVEREIQKYRGNHYLWHRHISGIELNPHQVAWMNDMDKKGDSHMLIGSRRIRKSFTVAAYFLEEAACLRYSEVNVHSPALEQSKRNLRYMADMVMNSEILLAYIDERLGEGLGKEHIEFMNRSLIQAKGQASSVDGLGATHQWLEEFDDMDFDSFLTRVYPTGSQIKDDHDYGNHTGCCRIITGTIKGIGNLYAIEHPENSRIKFNVLPKLNCWDGVAMGIIPANDIYLFQSISTPHQFARTYLVLYVESSAFYPDKWVRNCADPQYLPVSVNEDPKFTYQCTGDVTVGIDCAGAGNGEEASTWGITFTEKIGNKVFWLHSAEYPANERPGAVQEKMFRLINYFRPLTGFGDAFDVSFIYDLNLQLKNQGVTNIDVRRYENKSGANGWDEWYIKPLRFIGPTKHLMHERMQKYIYSCHFRYPSILEGEPEYASLEKLCKQFGNIKAERTGSGYNKYSILSKKLGDDIVDSLIASIWAQEEIRVTVVPAGGYVPQMQIAEAPGFSRLGPKFLNDGRDYNSSIPDQTIYDFLKQ